MEDLLLLPVLTLWWTWQAITAPFYPKPAKVAAEAEAWMRAHALEGEQLTQELIDRAIAAGLEFLELDEDTIRRNFPDVARLVEFRREVAFRPAIGIISVHKTMQLDAAGVIVSAKLNSTRSYL